MTRNFAFHRPVPTDGSWWLEKDREEFYDYVRSEANVRRMSGGRAASFVVGAENFGSLDRASAKDVTERAA